MAVNAPLGFEPIPLSGNPAQHVHLLTMAPESLNVVFVPYSEGEEVFARPLITDSTQGSLWIPRTPLRVGECYVIKVRRKTPFQDAMSVREAAARGRHDLAARLLKLDPPDRLVIRWVVIPAPAAPRELQLVEEEVILGYVFADPEVPQSKWVGETPLHAWWTQGDPALGHATRLFLDTPGRLAPPGTWFRVRIEGGPEPQVLLGFLRTGRHVPPVSFNDRGDAWLALARQGRLKMEVSLILRDGSEGATLPVELAPELVRPRQDAGRPRQPVPSYYKFEDVVTP